MSRTRPFVVLFVAFWLAAALQQTVAHRAVLFGVQPDFLVIVSVAAAVMFDPRVAAVLGFIAGALHGGVAGANMANFVISRTLAAYAAGYVSRLELDVRPWYVGLVVAAATVVIALLWMVPAPPPAVGPYLRDTIVAAMYNGLLAVPLYALLRRFLRTKVN